MGKESLYRRSFHCERDLKNMEKMLELEKGVLGKRTNLDTLRLPVSDGGFEAPRNSLDVPAAGFMEMRRHSEVRCEDIPIGYELSRSLTSRKRSDDFLVRKSMSAVDPILLKSKLMDKGNSDANQKSRVPSVVARLMGLDPLPHQREEQSLQCPNELSSKRVQPHDFFVSETGPCITKQASVSRVSSQRGTASVEESLSDQKPATKSSNALPFRDHPQEKQLQEFKKEFAVHQGKLPIPSKIDLQLGMHTEKGSQREKQGLKRESLQETQEFLDALDFLQTNKEFFAKVLKDPSSLFAKHLQQRGGGASKEGLGQSKGSKLTRSFSESKRADTTQGIEILGSKRGPDICLPLAHESIESDKTRTFNHLKSFDKESLIVCTSRFGQDEHMPQRYRPSSPLKPGNDQRMPTKIVVLRPKVGRHAKGPSTPLSPSSEILDATNIKARLEGKDGIAKHDVKERLRYEPSAARNFQKDVLKDSGDIARHIVEQVKEDMSRRLLSEISQPPELSSLVTSCRGKRAPAQRAGVNGDTSGASDGEGHCSSSRRMIRDNIRANVSLPSSPRLSRSEPEVDVKFYGDKGRSRGVCGEKKSSRSANTCRDARRDNVGIGRAPVLATNPDSMRDSKPQSSTRRGRNRGSFRDESEPSKVLQRSLSAPAIEIRALVEHERKRSMPVNRLASSNTSTRIAENSLLKEKLLSLKDSLLSKKKSIKKKNKPHSGTLDFGSPSPTVNVSGVSESRSTMLSVYQNQKAKPAMEGCLADGVSLNSKALSGVHQWQSMGDLFDSASDVSLEKCEQPSPVSVLVTPFHEESPSPEQSISVGNEASLGFSPLEPDYKKRLLDLQGALLSSSTSRQSSFNSSMEDSLCDSHGANMPLESLSICGIACACGAEDELVYIRDLLAFAGFTNNEYVKAHSFSREHGFKHSMFKKMESYYAAIKGTIGHTPLNFLSRKMLFDVVDEILSWKLREPTRQLGLTKREKLGFQVAYTGKQLLEQIWAHVSDHRYMPCEFSEEESLDALASKDLMKDASWMYSQSDMEAVAMEVEKLVCGDLIREMTHELKLILMPA